MCVSVEIALLSPALSLSPSLPLPSPEVFQVPIPPYHHGPSLSLLPDHQLSFLVHLLLRGNVLWDQFRTSSSSSVPPFNLEL